MKYRSRSQCGAVSAPLAFPLVAVALPIVADTTATCADDTLLFSESLEVLLTGFFVWETLDKLD